VAERMVEHTAQVVSNKVEFNGNVARVSSTTVAADAHAGVRTLIFTGATSPVGDEKFTKVYDAEREGAGSSHAGGPFWEITQYTSEEFDALLQVDRLTPELAEKYKDLLED
jgi:hypothetical protein